MNCFFYWILFKAVWKVLGCQILSLSVWEAHCTNLIIVFQTAWKRDSSALYQIIPRHLIPLEVIKSKSFSCLYFTTNLNVTLIWKWINVILFLLHYGMNYSILYVLCLLSHLCLGEMSFALWGYVLGWEVPYPPLHTSCNSGAVCSSQALRGQRSSSRHLKEITLSLLYLLAPVWGAQRIDGERSSWSLPSEIAAESKLLVGIRDKAKTKKWKKRDCCEAEKSQHRAEIMHWEPKARHKDIRLNSCCGNKPLVWWFQHWKLWQLNTQDIIQHHIFSCTILWAGYIDNILSAKSLVPHAQPTHL